MISIKHPSPSRALFPGILFLAGLGHLLGCGPSGAELVSFSGGQQSADPALAVTSTVPDTTALLLVSIESQESQADQEPAHKEEERYEYSAQELTLLQADDSADERSTTLARLATEFEMPSRSKWSIRAGCPRTPELPATLAGMGARLFLATADRVETYDVESETWSSEPWPLPMRVGSGVSLATDGAGTLFLASGGDRTSLWRINTESGVVLPLPAAPRLVGRGAALEFYAGDLYLVHGRRDTEFFLLEAGAEAWRSLGRIGGDSRVETSFGRNSGFLARVGADIFAWPDHHVQKFDADAMAWDNGEGRATWVAMGFRPAIDGGGVASDDELGSLYVAGGKYSRSLNEIAPGEQRAFHFLRPRLPYPLIGEGDRLAIARRGGVPELFVYAVEPDNKLCSLPCSAFERLSVKNNVADEGSPWRRVHSPGGGSGIRRRKALGAGGDIKTSQGTLGVLGALDEQLFLMRLAHVRRIEPDTGRFTYYPGLTLGRYLALGAAGTYDGERYLYMCTGLSDYFVRWDVPRTRPEKKRMSYPRPSIHETELEVLPPMPGEVGKCASLAFQGDRVFALRGAGTRDFWCYIAVEERWEILAPLPPEASAPGDKGGCLVADASGVYALPDEHVWRYDIASNAWAHFAELPFAPDWDGGMAALDGEGRLYVVRGNASTRLGRLDLETRDFEELVPGPPDVISAEGNRLGILSIRGERRLYLHRGHNSNEILWIPLAELSPREEE